MKLLSNWIILGIIKVFLASFLILVQRYYKIDSDYLFPITVHIVSSIFLIFILLKTKEYKNINKLDYKLVLLSSISAAAIILVSYKLIKITPNPAYIRIFSAIDMILVLLISGLIFKQKITLPMIIGFMFIFIGFVILCCYI
jgi:uncharacterized membrane protein